MSRQKFHVTRNWVAGPNFEFDIRFGEQGSGDRFIVAQPVTMFSVGPNERPPDGAMISVTREALQTLMDELWAAGIRPSDIGTPGHLEATKAHLEDMRKLVSSVYMLDLPKPPSA